MSARHSAVAASSAISVSRGGRLWRSADESPNGRLRSRHDGALRRMHLEPLDEPQVVPEAALLEQRSEIDMHAIAIETNTVRERVEKAQHRCGERHQGAHLDALPHGIR